MRVKNKFERKRVGGRDNSITPNARLVNTNGSFSSKPQVTKRDVPDGPDDPKPKKT